MPEPLVSVVMPVHNGLPFLSESIQCILNQSLTDFEFVILDDESTDGSREVMREWEKKDKRIHVCTSAQHLGLSASSNAVVREAGSQLIARMDADDLCEPGRLERQWKIMRDNPGIAVVGTLCDGVDARGKRVRPRDRSRIMRRSGFPPFPHGSVMMRRRIFEEVGGYRAGWDGYEDRDLFRRMAARGAVVTLPEVLYHYRYHLQSSSAKSDPDVLSRPELGGAGKVNALYSLGAMRLWAGDRPAILRAVLADNTGEWNVKRLMVASWALWADLHPSSLRSFSRMVVRTRDLVASTRVSDGSVYEWRFE